MHSAILLEAILRRRISLAKFSLCGTLNFKIMQITYVGTQEDFINGQRTHQWRRYSATAAKLQKIISPLLGCVFLYIGFRWYQRRANPLLIALEVFCGLYVIFAQPISGLLFR